MGFLQNMRGFLFFLYSKTKWEHKESKAERRAVRIPLKNVKGLSLCYHGSEVKSEVIHCGSNKVLR